MTQKKKHPKPRKNLVNTDRSNGKAWKRGKAPDKR